MIKAIQKPLWTAAIALFTANLLNAQGIQGDTVSCKDDFRYYTFAADTGKQYEWQVQGGSITETSADTLVVQWTVNTFGLVTLLETDLQSGITDTFRLYVQLSNSPEPFMHSNFASGCTPLAPDGRKEHENSACYKVCDSMPMTFYAHGNAGSTFTWTVVGIFDTIYWTSDSIRLQWTATGTALVSLKETTAGGCEGIAVYCIDVKEKPRAAFSIDYAGTAGNAVSVCLGQSVRFTNTTPLLGANEGSTDVSWFVDGVLAGTGNPEIPFNEAGTHSVTMVVRNECNCTDTAFATVTVESQPPAEIVCAGVVCEGDTVTYSSPTPCSSYHFSVTGSNSYTASGNSVTVIWNQIPPSGYGQVWLDSSSNCSGVCRQPAVVNIPVIQQHADIQGATVICASSGQFAYSVPFWAGTAYSWEIVSSTGTVSANLQDTAENRVWLDAWGSGSITLRVTYWNDLLKCGGDKQITIQVKPELHAWVSQYTVCANDTFSVHATFDSLGAAYSWGIADGNEDYSNPQPIAGATDSMLTYSIATPGSYYFTVQNPNFCNPKAVRILVTPIPPPPLVINGEDSLCPNEYMTFTAAVTSPQYYLQWEITDGPVITTDEGPAVSWRFGSSNGPYIVRVWQVNALNPGCRSEALEKTLYRRMPPAFHISGLDTVCTNTTTVYSSDLSGGTDYYWKLSNPATGSVFNTQSSSLEVQWNNIDSLPITVQIYLSATACATTLHDTMDVLLREAPDPHIALTDSSCAGNTLHFTATGLDTADGYTWTLLPGTVLPGNSPATSHFFNGNAHGTYTVHLAVQQPDGCPVTREVSRSFTVLPLPVANISLLEGETSYCSDSAFDIDNVYARIVRSSQDSANYVYIWLFNSDTAATGTDSYTVEDTLGSVSLLVVDTVSGCSRMSNIIHIVAQPCIEDCVSAPVITVSAASRTCNTVTFWAESITPPQFQSGSLLWSMDDSLHTAYATNDTFTHTYTHSGIYWVKVRTYFYQNNGTIITDSSEICQEDTLIRIVVPLVPRANYGFVCNGSNSLQISYNNLSDLVAGKTTVTAIQWQITDIDNGNTTVYSGSTPPAVLPQGNYAVTMSVTYDYNDGLYSVTGETCSVTDTVQVPGSVQAAFTYAPNPVCEGTPVFFSSQSTGDIAGWYWSYGDGTSSLRPDSSVRTYSYDEHLDVADNYPDTISNPTPSGYNKYLTFLILTDIYGCRDTVYGDSVKVYPDNFHYRITGDTFACSGTVVILNTEINGDDPDEDNSAYDPNIGSTSPVRWHWSTGDTTAAITVGSTARYTVEMYDTFGCRQWAEHKVNFVPLPAIPITAPDRVCYGAGFRLEAPQHTGYSGYTWQHTLDTLGSWNIIGTTYALAEAAGYPSSFGSAIMWSSGIHYIRLILEGNQAGGMACNDTSLTYQLRILDMLPIPDIALNFDCTLPAVLHFTNVSDFVNPVYNWTTGTVNVDSTQVFFAGDYYLYLTDSFGCTTANHINVEVPPILAGMGMGCQEVCDTTLPATVFTHISADNWAWLYNGSVVLSGNNTADIPLPVHSPDGDYRLAIGGFYNSIYCTDTLDYTNLDVRNCCNDSVWIHLRAKDSVVCRNAIFWLEVGFGSTGVFIGSYDGYEQGWETEERTAQDLIDDWYSDGDGAYIQYDPVSNIYTIPLVLEDSDTGMIFIIPHNGDSLHNATCIGDTVWVRVIAQECRGCDSLALTAWLQYEYADSTLYIEDISYAPYGYDILEIHYKGQYYSGAPHSTAAFTMENINDCDTAMIVIGKFIGEVCCFDTSYRAVCLKCDDIDARESVQSVFDGSQWHFTYSSDWADYDYLSWTFPDGSQQAASTVYNPNINDVYWTDSSTGGVVCVIASYKLGSETSPCGSTYTKCCNKKYCFNLNPADPCDIGYPLIVYHGPDGYSNFNFQIEPDYFFDGGNVIVNKVWWYLEDGTHTAWTAPPTYDLSYYEHTYTCFSEKDTVYHERVVVEYSYYAYGQYNNCQTEYYFDVFVPQCTTYTEPIVYPNPANNELNIVFNGVDISKAWYGIYTMRGKTVLPRQKILRAHETVSLGDWTEGTYLIIIENGENKHSVKFIKK